MQKLNIQLENCYGIGKLDYTFEFTNSNTILIYASNGTMKSSLAKTLNYFSASGLEAPSDRIYPARASIYKLNWDENEEIDKTNILVVNPDSSTYDASHKISSFVASKELKKEYENIYQELDLRKNEFIRKLKSISISTDCESELHSTFSKNDKDSFFEILENILKTIDKEQPKFNFKYNDVFDKKGSVKKFIEKEVEHLGLYLKYYEELLGKSSFFKKSSNSFGTYQASEILKSIDDNSYFEAGHALEINGQTKIRSSTKLKELVEAEINSIVNNKDLKKIFDKVDKAIGSNAELRSFKKIIEADNLLLVHLTDYEGFKRKVWYGYLNELIKDAVNLSNYYNDQREKLNKIISEAKKEIELWKTLIDKFNSRFYVPFRVVLSNQEDVILKESVANLEFLYIDGRDTEAKQEKEALLKVLSRGEQKAYYILQLLFDIESRRKLAQKTLLVLDDIADSFDYKNKFAIIEYVKDLHDSGQFRILILTHNFDFYRNIYSKLNLPRDEKAVLMVTKNEHGQVKFSAGQYLKDAFKYFLSQIKNPKIFISLIPFFRNLFEYTEGQESEEYKILTKCLHIKDGSYDLSVGQIVELWKAKFSKCYYDRIDFSDKKVIQMIFDIADELLTENSQFLDEVSLENKIVLSIAIRLKAEEFMIKVLPESELNSLSPNQTQKLFEKYKSSDVKNAHSTAILDKVIMMTPDNIHLNTFMYEPLIDISIWHLNKLYKEVKALEV